jgi:predicted Fe-Mo cluster-binding NifX family protein
MITEAGTDVLIIGQLGPKAARVLSKSGIKIYECTSGTVKEAIRALQQNRLKELSEAQPGPGKMGGRGMGGGGGTPGYHVQTP